MKFSVIVPCFNVQHDLENCVRSLHAALTPGDEIIIVDDASTDGTLTVARSIAEDDPSITVVPLAENVGVSQARNQGIQVSSGDAVGFVDPDDVVTPDYRNTLVSPFEDPRVDIVVGKHRVSDEGRGIVRDAPFPTTDAELSGAEALALMARRRLPSSVCFMAFRRAYLGAARPFRRGTRFEDFIFLSDNLALADRVALRNSLIYTYRRGHVSETGTLRPSVLDLLVGSEAMRQALNSTELAEAESLTLIADASIRVSICDQASVFGHEDPALARRVLTAAREPFDFALVGNLVGHRRLVLAAQVAVLTISPPMYGAIVRTVRELRGVLARSHHQDASTATATSER